MRQVSKVLEQTNKILKADSMPSQIEAGQIKMSPSENSLTASDPHKKKLARDEAAPKREDDDFETVSYTHLRAHET